MTTFAVAIAVGSCRDLPPDPTEPGHSGRQLDVTGDTVTTLTPDGAAANSLGGSFRRADLEKGLAGDRAERGAFAAAASAASIRFAVWYPYISNDGVPPAATLGAEGIDATFITGDLTATVLADYDVLFIGRTGMINPDPPASIPDINAVISWVAAGGVLISESNAVIYDSDFHRTQPWSSTLSGIMGISGPQGCCDVAYSGDEAVTITDAGHPIAAGVAASFALVGNHAHMPDVVIDLAKNSTATQIGTVMPYGWPDKASPIVAAEYGEGCTVYFPTAVGFGGMDWSANPDYQRLFLNAIEYCARSGQVAGTVTDSESLAAIAGATVQVLDASGAKVASTTTDANGAYFVRDLAPATGYELTVQATGYHAGSSDPFSVVEDQTTTVDVQLDIVKGAIEGTVRVEGTGLPIGGAAITITPDGGTPLAPLTTDANGFYTSGLLRPGDYDVEVTAGGFQGQNSATNIPFGGGTTTQDFDLFVAFSITAQNPDGSLAPFVTATLTNIDAAEFYVACTDANGVASFEVPGGNYLAHVRNLGHDPNLPPDPATTLCGSDNLSVWPDQQDQFFNTSNSAAQNRVGVLFHATDGSIVLNPDNYRRVVDPTLDGPQLVLGVGGPTSITLQFQLGATLVCNLLDQNGNPITLQSDENVNFVLPFGADGNPVNFDNPGGLPEGIGNIMAALFAGTTADGQGASGAPAGTYACETTEVTISGETFVYREIVEVTEEDAANGNTVEEDAEPEPVRAETNYLFEPYGDSQGRMDLGFVTYGFGGDADGNVTDVLHVSTDFKSTAPQGEAAMYFELVDPATGSVLAAATAVCREAFGAYRCVLTSSTGAPVTFSGTGTYENRIADGNMTFSVSIPGVTAADFRVLAGDRPQSTQIDDRAPDAGYERVTKPTSGGGNSFMVKGD